mmetsp:Transcript_2531/g.3350  ORF Transcript_2531/g.3350 Transcript_2531/m.3350 type:complete len:485 (-) Transcript_2531:120-1574(-)
MTSQCEPIDYHSASEEEDNSIVERAAADLKHLARLHPSTLSISPCASPSSLELDSKFRDDYSSSSESLSLLVGGIPVKDDKYLSEKIIFSGIPLGEGATSSVQLATDKQTQKSVAIKIIPVTKLRNNASLQREVSILKRLDHPNIVKLIDVVLTRKNLYIIMEYIEGTGLFDYLVENKNNYNELQARTILNKLFQAVAYLHEKGIAHRDIKPENIICVFSKKPNEDQEVDIKLVDFGVACTFENGTGMRTPVGTLGFKSPEILKHQDYDKGVDCWALGVLAYIMLCGIPPFFSDPDQKEDESMLQNAPFWIFFNKPSIALNEQVIQGKMEFPQVLWGRVSKEAQQFVSSLLQVDPLKRMTASQALQHPWMQLDPKDLLPSNPDFVEPSANKEFTTTLTQNDNQISLNGKSLHIPIMKQLKLLLHHRSDTGPITDMVNEFITTSIQATPKVHRRLQTLSKEDRQNQLWKRKTWGYKSDTATISNL